MAANIQKKKKSRFKWPWNRGQSASSGRGTSTATSGFSQAISSVAVPGNSTTPPSSTSTPTQPPPRRKLGLVNLTPDLGDDQTDPRFPDIVAIHGIGGDAYKTWTHENGTLWLRDILPKSIKGARVFSFGYDAEVVLTKSQAELDDFARSLLNKLRVERDHDQLQSRPLIFICHSMGGIVLKKALTIARLEADDEFPFLRSSVKGMFFLGTPHRGSDAVRWPQLLADILYVGLFAGTGLAGGPRKDLLQDLERNSATLKSISTEFRNQAKNIKIFSCIEQHSTPPLSKLIVDRHTGVLDFPGEVIIPMDGCDHRTLCRFSSKEDPNYRVICSRMRQLIDMPMQPEPKTKEQKDCLKHLYFSEMEVRQHDISPAADNTCGWLLKHKTFREWSGHNRGLLWISGNPGAGKSTLLKYALQKITNDESITQNKPIILFFFFHGRGAELQRTTLGFFQSILYQILDQVPSALSDLVQDFKRNCEAKGNPGEKWNWHEAELRGFLKQSIPKILEEHSIRIFVDAIDEGGDKVARELVREFQSLLAQPCAKSNSTFLICFTCRHYPIIEFEGQAKICVEKENHEDIVSYVRGRLTDNNAKVNEIRDMIIERASGIFQWARLVVDRVKELLLEGKVVKKVKEEIQQIPSDLHKLYRGLLERISQQERPEVLDLIYWVLFALRPLSLDELRLATAIQPDLPYKSLRQYQDEGILTDSNEEMERRVKSLSRGLAEIRAQKGTPVVQFIHQSVNDFLLEDGIEILLDSNWESIDMAIGRAHYQLSRSCIRYIDMDEIRQESENWEKSEERKEMAKSPFLKYATISWALHTERAHGNGISQEDILDYLHWPSDDLVRQWAKTYDKLDRYSENCPPTETTVLHIISTYGLLGPLSAALVSIDDGNVQAKANSKDNRGRTPLSWAAGRGHKDVVKLLVDRGDVEADSKDNSGRTPLSWAAEAGHEAVVKLLVERGDVEADSKDNSGRTPLLWAAGRGHKDVVKLLVERGDVEADSKDDYFGQTPLSWAAERGHEPVVKLLVERGDVEADSKDNNGRTPLSWAAEAGHEAVVKLLVERGDVEAASKDNNGRTPLSWAAGCGHKDVVKLLVERGDVEADSKDDIRRTPLSWAAGYGHEPVVKLLVERGDVEADLKDKYGQTPLSWAAERGHEAVVKLLVERGDVEAHSKDDMGRTPLSWAAERGHEVVVKLLVERGDVEADSKDDIGRTPLSWAAGCGHEPVVTLLVERGYVEADSKDKYGQTPLSLAAERGHEPVVKLLAERGDVEADSKDNMGWTPLSRAAGGGHEAVVKLLVERGDVEADSKDNSERTPLSQAAGGGHEAVVKLLVERGDVEADSKNNMGQTPLSRAAERGHEPVVKLLIERGDIEPS